MLYMLCVSELSVFVSLYVCLCVCVWCESVCACVHVFCVSVMCVCVLCVSVL